jgi:hypothetical protein
MTNHDLGANQFTFSGDRTRINYETQTPIPNQGPLLQYQGPEGDHTFAGDQVTCLDSALGTLLTVVLRPNADAGAISITIAIKTTSRGFINTPGMELTYDVLPLVGQASQVLLP